MLLSNSFRHVVIMIIFLIQPHPLICSKFNDYRMYRRSIPNKNQRPTPPVLLKPTQYESLATLPSQEVYDVEHPRRSSNTEEDQSIMHHKSSVGNIEDEFSQEISTIHNPIVNGDNEFSSEFSARQYNQNLSMVGTEESHLLNNEVADAQGVQQSPLTSNGSAIKTPSLKKNEIKYVLSIQNLTAYLTGESPNDYSEFINDNLINFVDENAYCRGYDLSVNFVCLKQKLMQHIRYLSSHKALKFTDTVSRVSYPVAETRYVSNN